MHRNKIFLVQVRQALYNENTSIKLSISQISTGQANCLILVVSFFKS